MESFFRLLLSWAIYFIAFSRDLLMPRGCAGCDAPDQVLCSGCTSYFYQPETFQVRGYEMDSGYACGKYSGAVRRAILQWKDHDDLEVTSCFDAAMRQLVEAVFRQIDLKKVEQILVVPAPSSSASIHRRGRIHLQPLAQGIAEQLQKMGYSARAKQLLSMRAVTKKAVQIHGAVARSQRIKNHVQVSRQMEDLGCIVILVDDIVTTGSTASQCALVLRQSGFVPLTVLTLARAGLVKEEGLEELTNFNIDD